MSSSGPYGSVPPDRGRNAVPAMARLFSDDQRNLNRAAARLLENQALFAMRMNAFASHVPGGIGGLFNQDIHDPEGCGGIKSLQELVDGKELATLKREYEHARQAKSLATNRMEARKAVLMAQVRKSALQRRMKQEGSESIKAEADAPAHANEGPGPSGVPYALRSGGKLTQEDTQEDTQEELTDSEVFAKVEELEREALLMQIQADYMNEMHGITAKLQATGFNFDEWEEVVQARLDVTCAAILPKFLESLEESLSKDITKIVPGQREMGNAEKLRAYVAKLQELKSPDNVEVAVEKLSGLFILAPLRETQAAVPISQVREELETRLSTAISVADLSVPYRMMAYISILPDGPNSGLGEIKRKLLARERSALYKEDTLFDLMKQIDQYKTETVRVTKEGNVVQARGWNKASSGSNQKAGNSGNAGSAGKGASVGQASVGKPGAGGRAANAGNNKPGESARAARADEAGEGLCFRCNKPGHIRRFCPEKPKQDAKGKPNASAASTDGGMDFTSPQGGAGGARSASAFSAIYLDEVGSEPEESGSEDAGMEETTASATDMVASERDVLAATAAAASAAEPAGLRMVFDTRADVSLMGFVPEGATPTRALIRWGGMDSVASRVEATWTGTLDVQDAPTGKWTKVTGRFLCVPGLEFDFLVGRDTYGAGVRVEDGPRGTTIRQKGMCLRSGPTGVYQVRMGQSAASAAPVSANDGWTVVGRNARKAKDAGTRGSQPVRRAPVQGLGNGNGRRN